MNKIVNREDNNSLVETLDIFQTDHPKQAVNKGLAQDNTYDGIFVGINSGWNIKAKIHAKIKIENKIVNAEICRDEREFLQRYVPIGSKLTIEFKKNKWCLANLKISKSEFRPNIVINDLEQPR